MQITGKRSTITIFGLISVLLTFALVIGTFPGIAGAEEDISKYNEPWNGVMVYKNGGKIIELNQMKNIKKIGGNYTNEQIGEFFVSNVKTIAREMGRGYGARSGKEILEINGKPWQETEYRDLIISMLGYDVESPFNQYTELYKYVQEPKYNGRAVEVIQWVKNEKTKSEPIEDDQKTSNETDNETEPDELEDECTLCDNQKEVAPNKQNQTRVVLEIGSKTVSIEKDGVKTGSQIDNAPFMQNNITYIPVKGVFDKLGAEIDWDSATRTVTIQSDNKLEMVPWSKTIIVDGEEVQVENPAIIVNGRTFLPVRVVAENLNHKVEWKAETREIIIQ